MAAVTVLSRSPVPYIAHAGTQKLQYNDELVVPSSPLIVRMKDPVGRLVVKKIVHSHASKTEVSRQSAQQYRAAPLHILLRVFTHWPHHGEARLPVQSSGIPVNPVAGLSQRELT